MKALLISAEFHAELPGWLVRGALCAINSIFWALLLDFRHPWEMAGMVAGVGCWVAIFAGICARVMRSGGWSLRVGAALKAAAWIKIGLTVAGWLLLATVSGLGLGGGAEQIAFLGMVDLMLGMAALWLVALVAGLGDPAKVAGLDSFGWTTLTTVTEGALMALVIGALAAMVMAGWKFREGLSARRPFPADRSMD
jgi:hypothetical protein